MRGWFSIHCPTVRPAIPARKSLSDDGSAALYSD
jgi:hypothetical protein